MSKQSEPVYPARKPTKILNATHGNVTVVTTLYGEVTPEREAKEQAAAQYRAEQLSPLPPRPKREFIPREARDDSFDDAPEKFVRRRPKGRNAE